jgi:ankyrin repeat protein
MEIPNKSPLAEAVRTAIRGGDAAGLRELLTANPGLATARVVGPRAETRTLLHVATDWPGHFPRVAETIGVLIAFGSDPNVAMTGGNAPERPLHWAASSNDVAAIDALLDGGADIEGPGAIFTNGTAMSDAVIFAQWDAARRLLARGAKTTLTQAAGLGLMDRMRAFFAAEPGPEREMVTAGLWHACRGGQLETVQYLAAQGGDVHWVGWDNLSPLDCAVRGGNPELVAWLIGQGARHARVTAC